jgi:hypothetical protein
MSIVLQHTSNLLQQAAANAAAQAAAETSPEAEGAKIGAAAARKQKEESADSLDALLASEGRGGKGVAWQRRMSTPDGVRYVTMIERAGAYSEREFLRLCNGAAAAAVMGGWRNSEAVESVGAEIVCRVLAKTSGRMPRRGQLGQRNGAKSENPDAAYLTGMARTLIASAQRGDRDAAGLAAEAIPMAAAEGAETVNLSDLMGNAAAEAEANQQPDPYLADPIPPAHGHAGPAAPARGDVLTPSTRTRTRALAIDAVGRKGYRAVEAAIISALRPTLRAADLAAYGDLAPTPTALRKARERGRDALQARLSALPLYGPHTEADTALLQDAAALTLADAAQQVERHISEQGPPPYRGTTMRWPDRVRPDVDAPVKVSALDPEPEAPECPGHPCDDYPGEFPHAAIGDVAYCDGSCVSA